MATSSGRYWMTSSYSLPSVYSAMKEMSIMAPHTHACMYAALHIMTPVTVACASARQTKTRG